MKKLFLIALLCTSCHLRYIDDVAVQYWQLAHVKKQHEVNDSTNALFLSQFNFRPTIKIKASKNLITALGDSAYHLNTYKYLHQGLPSLIQCRVYNHQGNIESAYSQCFGTVQKWNLDQLPLRFNHWPVNRHLTMAQETLYLGKVLKNIKASSFDYCFIVYWNETGNLFTKTMLKKIDEFVTNNSNLSIKIVLVNTDEFSS